jgi:arsenate reductase
MEIWHNPRCSKSRATLALLKERGVEPEVVLYLEAPPTRERLEEVLRLLKMQPRELMRKGESIYAELGLDDESLNPDTLLRAMVEHPVLIERPIVIAGSRAVIGRPPERVIELF